MEQDLVNIEHVQNVGICYSQKTEGPEILLKL